MLSEQFSEQIYSKHVHACTLAHPYPQSPILYLVDVQQPCCLGHI